MAEENKAGVALGAAYEALTAIEKLTAPYIAARGVAPADLLKEIQAHADAGRKAIVAAN